MPNIYQDMTTDVCMYIHYIMKGLSPHWDLYVSLNIFYTYDDFHVLNELLRKIIYGKFCTKLNLI